MKAISVLLLPLIFLISTSLKEKKNDEPVDYLNTGNMLKFGNTKYKLSWSSRPVTNYFKQEYLPAGDNADHFNSMVLIDFLGIDTPAVNIARLKVNELIERKKTDQVCNYKFQQNIQKGEYLLDFIMSSGSGDKVDLVELNGYRYKNYTDKNGHKGVLLFGMSLRAYGDDVLPFLRKLGDKRHEMLKTLTEYDIPEIEIK